jgi:hypothetical protein
MPTTTLIYDSDCGISRWLQATVLLAGSAGAGSRTPALLR